MGCKSIDVAEWTEDVRLADGRVVSVSRRVRAHAGGFPNARRGADIDNVLAVPALGLTWQHTQASDNIRYPLALDVLDGQPVLVLRVGDRGWCKGRPERQYTAELLRWTAAGWQAAPLEPAAAARLRANLHVRHWGSTTASDARGHYTESSKQPAGEPGETLARYMERDQHFCEHYQKF